MTKSSPSEQTLLEIYKAQWADIHHSRQQDWELLKLVIVGLVGVGGLNVLGEHMRLQILASLFFLLVSLLAIAVTMRHKALFLEKMAAIRRIESQLGFDSKEYFKPLSRSHFFTTQNILIVVYVIFFALFAYFATFLLIELL